MAQGFLARWREWRERKRAEREAERAGREASQKAAYMRVMAKQQSVLDLTRGKKRLR